MTKQHFLVSSALISLCWNCMTIDGVTLKNLKVIKFLEAQVKQEICIA